MVVKIAAKTRTHGKRPLWIQRVLLVICSGSTVILFPVATVRHRRMEIRSSTMRATGIAWSLSILSTLTVSITSKRQVCIYDLERQCLRGRNYPKVFSFCLCAIICLHSCLGPGLSYYKLFHIVSQPAGNSKNCASRGVFAKLSQ